MTNDEPRLIRAEPEDAKVIFDLLLQNVNDMTSPVNLSSFAEFQEGPFQNSIYLWYRDVKDVYALLILFHGDQQVRQVEFGVISLAQRKGHAAAALFALGEHVFGTMGLNRMYCKVNEDNIACLNLIEKHGRMTLEGKTRQTRFKNGEYVDQRIYSILAEDWK